MRVVAIGKREILMGFMLAGIRERLETEDSNEALEYLHELEDKESDYLVLLPSDLYSKIEDEIAEIQNRNPSYVFYKFSGGGIEWRKE
jgi:vacuolar-type H+-ATPase subunit F/Vma7